MSKRFRWIPLVAGALLAVCACAPPEPPPVRNIVLISIDTLRADHLGAYGYTAPTSPNLDIFASDGVLFEDASSTAPWTLPAHVSLLTGLYPRGHGVRLHVHGLADDVPTLATLLSDRDFDTAAFVNAYFLENAFGLTRGFDVYRSFREDQSRNGATPEILQAARRWLDPMGDRPFFLFIHLFDVHSDYRSLPRYERMFTDGPGRYDGSTIQLMMGMTERIPFEPPDARHLSGLYDAGIRQLDDRLGVFLAWLGRKWLKNTLVIVTSDHGEEFLDHGSMVHGGTHYQELLHVPLMLVGPTLPPGTRIPAPVSLVDLMPTVLDLVGVDAPQGIDGRSLRPLWEGAEADPDRLLLAETGPMKLDAFRSLRRGRYKLIQDTRSGERTLYDLGEDPRETRDVTMDHPELARALSESLDAMMQSPREPYVLGNPTEEDEARLRALGYLEP